MYPVPRCACHADADPDSRADPDAHEKLHQHGICDSAADRQFDGAAVSDSDHDAQPYRVDHADLDRNGQFHSTASRDTNPDAGSAASYAHMDRHCQFNATANRTANTHAEPHYHIVFHTQTDDSGSVGYDDRYRYGKSDSICVCHAYCSAVTDTTPGQHVHRVTQGDHDAHQCEPSDVYASGDHTVGDANIYRR